MTSSLLIKDRPRVLGLALLLAACGSNGGTSETAGVSEGASSSSASASSTGGPETTMTGGQTTSASAGTGTDSQATNPTSDPTTTDSSVSDSSSTTNPTDATSTTTTGETTAQTTGTSDTTGMVEDTTGTTEPVEDTTGTSTTGPDCVPSPEVCNDLDDDCDDIVDNVDEGGDGICDCLSIAIWGNKGANPSSQFETWLEAQGTEVDRIQIANEPVTPQLLAKYDIVILDWLTRSYSPQEAQVIDEWVKNGGGLMSLTGHVNTNTVIDRPNSIIKPMGLSYNGSKGFFSGPVTQWTMHPITEGITSVSFYGGLYIDIVDDGLGVNETIGTLPQGPVAVAQVRKNGKLFIFGDEWIEFDSEWQNIPQIKKFWANSLGWLSPQNFCTIPQ